MVTRRVATIACGVAVLIIGHFVGGYGGAAVTGAGLGIAIVGVGRREPYLLRRRGDEERDADPDRWSEW